MADLVVSMDVRLAIAFMLQADPATSVTAFCSEQGISRQTYYKFKRRFEAGGLEALLPRSRRPRSSPNATPASVLAVVIEKRQQLKAEGWDCGALSIHHRMVREGPAPSARTIHRILVTHGLVEPQPRKRPRSSFRSFAYSRPNECWQMDGHDLRLADGTAFKALRIQDDCSRQVMATLAAWSENAADIWECFETACQRHGTPAMFLSDNGSAFSQRRTRGLMGEFEARLRACGVLPVTSSIKHPQTCGKKEREWQTLDQWLAAHPAPQNLHDAQRLFDTYDWLFNHDRPHQAHHGKTPAEVYATTEKASAAQTPLAHPAQIHDVRVNTRGVIRLGQGNQMSIGTRWAGATVTVLREDPACAVFDGQELIEFIHIDPHRNYQPRTRR
jgi:transposase InsO family protein